MIDEVRAARAAGGGDPARAEARERAAGLLRQMGSWVVSTDASATSLRHFGEVLDVVCSALPGLPGATRYEAADTPVEAMARALDTHPVGGTANPAAQPMTLEVEEERVVTRVTFGPTHEGTPGCVHGGFVAATFDQVLGAAAARSGVPIVTGTLTVHYRRPTPLNEELVFEAELERVEGRRVHTAGRVHAGGTLTARADAVFVRVDDERYLGGS
jgi:acyl-coenzyme A thioesterase PaaI-like protein